MFEYFAFVDESTAKRYRLCLVAVPSSDLPSTRKALKQLVKPGQRQIHMTKESIQRRKQIIAAALELPGWRAIILEMPAGARRSKADRKTLFLLAASHAIWLDIHHLVIEASNEETRDRAALSWIKQNGATKFDYQFSSSADEPGLWLPDLIGWAYARGGVWRDSIKQRIEVIQAP